MNLSDDPFGNACLAYLKGKRGLEITVKWDGEDDVIPVDYLFRTYEEMPSLEQHALNLCHGNILDIGAGAGCHSKYLSKKFPVTAIDFSIGAVKAMEHQNIRALHQNIYEWEPNEKFDTILALMNGSGIAGELDSLPTYLNKCKELLSEDGQILMDSSDIKYLYQDEDGTLTYLPEHYYGEINYKMVFEESETPWFKWLYVDFDSLKEAADSVGLNCQLEHQGEHHDYLARLTIVP